MPTCGPVTTWATGVITAPRGDRTLPRCLESLAAAGWDSPWVFAEAGAAPPEVSTGQVVARCAPALGAWANWLLGLIELVQREPRADAYLMVEDDALFCRNVRALLEQLLWPANPTACVSLYCSQAYQMGSAGFHVIDRGWDLIGAVAMVFPNESAHRLITDDHVVRHRRDGPYDGRKNNDSVIGRWAREIGWPVYLCCPSLVQHIGHCSTIGAYGAQGDRAAADFPGVEYDATALRPLFEPTADSEDSPTQHESA